MKTSNRRLALASLAGIVATLSLGLAAPFAHAQAWPTKQVIKIVSPYAPGGTTDVLARLLAQRLQEKLGQNVIVENRAGAGGNLGTDIVAKAAPDGHTLLLAASGPIVISPSLYQKLPYQPLKDFTYISPLAGAPFVVVVNANSGLNTLKDVIAKGKEGKLSFASAGSGTPQHIIGEMFNIQAGTKIQHIPYKGSGPAMNDLMGGQVPLAFENPIVAMPHVKSGRLKVLAVTGATRSANLPDVPTVAELGLTGFEARPWYGLLGPANMPADVTNKLNAAVEEFLASPAIKQRLDSLGSEPMYMPAAQFKTFVASELEKWTKVVKTSGATVD
ncbi:MAG: hypothetical protein JWR22_1403 [Herminiimonas sp.]|nr:hypothetical protein [Herminiimonas sp.]